MNPTIERGKVDAKAGNRPGARRRGRGDLGSLRQLVVVAGKRIQKQRSGATTSPAIIRTYYYWILTHHHHHFITNYSYHSCLLSLQSVPSVSHLIFTLPLLFHCSASSAYLSCYSRYSQPSKQIPYRLYHPSSILKNSYRRQT